MKEIVVISGKGGTGKTSLTASFAYLGAGEIIVADCDVDAADMHVFLQPDFANEKDFYSGQVAVIDPGICTDCGKCVRTCRFDAIHVINGRHTVNALDCEGCGYCSRICPVKAITDKDNHVGWWYCSAIKTGTKMLHAKMKVGAENSGKLVARVKKEANAQRKKKRRSSCWLTVRPGSDAPWSHRSREPAM
ncbi:MAG: 4Fe-4S binding protein [Candidatus Marinimicrobia bacterium]|nr:4Fe-4S binding protein [Candidatus Neomarinimicrobiota bacterium]